MSISSYIQTHNIHEKNHDGDGLLGPNSITVVYIYIYVEILWVWVFGSSKRIYNYSYPTCSPTYNCP